MRVLAPTFALEPDRIVLAAELESERLAPGATIRLWAPRHLLGRLDVGSTPFVPIGAALAAALGEDVSFAGPASPATVAGAAAVTAVMAGWWAGEGWRAPVVGAPPAAPLPPDPSRGHGLCFSLGVDSWASLLHLRRDPSGPPVTHLITVAGTDQRRPDVQTAVMAATRLAAARVGLPLVELGTDAREVLDPIASWEQLHGAVLASAALLLAPLLAQVTIAGSHSDANRPAWGSHVDLDHHWSSESTTVHHDLGHTARVDKVAMVAADPVALAALYVCWEGGEATNCGRCPKCLRTMTALDLVGALGRTPAFPPTIDPEAVRRSRPDSAGFVAELVERLPPGALRAAWAAHLEPVHGRRRLVGLDRRPMAGPDGTTRVALALAGTGWQADRDADTTDLLAIGWAPGQVPLRPARGTHRAIRAAAADHARRPVPWVVADMADPDRVNDPWATAVADRAEEVWGPGLCYLAGVGWAHEPGPTLDGAAVGRLLRAARVRLWWGPLDGLDPLRLVETIEHGCLPLQVVPAAEAEAIRHLLPPALATLVTDLGGLATFAIDPARTAALFEAAAAIVLAGSAERDLALDAVQHRG